MPRVELRVPNEEKEEAKGLGARWDAESRLWFVPDGVDPARFERWLPVDCAPNVRALSYFIATSARDCRRCHATTRVHGFILPAGHETLFVGDEPGDDVWEAADEPTLLCYIDYLAPPVVARIGARTDRYRIAYSRLTRSFHWMNHCEHCGAPLGDHETYCEPGHGFLVFTVEEAKRVSLSPIAEPFAANCGSYSIGVTLFGEMNKCRSEVIP